jgi:hypothetical protein
VQGVSDDKRDEASRRIKAAANLHDVALHKAGWRELFVGRSAGQPRSAR